MWIPNQELRNIRMISKGASYELYEGEFKGQVCAAKFITPPFAQIRTLDVKLNRFVKENRQLCELSHPNLVKLIGLIVLYKEVKLVVLMELIKGMTLDKLICDGGALSEEVIRNYSKQVCSALKYLHSNDVVHRNINSTTVIITNPDNHVKLIDFGLTIQLLDACSFQSSATARGLPQYLAPEMLEVTESSSRSLYSRGSDIWAFGCLVYEMAAGKKPHAECKNILAISRRIVKDPPPLFPDQYSETLKNFYRSCMAKDRRERKPAAELLEHDFLVNAPPSQSGDSTIKEASETAEASDDTRAKLEDDKIYNVASSKHTGFCLILFNDEYEGDVKFQNLVGIEEDADRIGQVFKKLNFKVCALRNRLSHEIFASLHQEAAAFDQCGCFICFIIGGGDCGIFYSKNGKVLEIRDIVTKFQSTQCPNLNSKPKIFIVQTCSTQTKAPDAKKYSFRIRENDFLVCCTGVSSTNETADSFVKTLCNLIEDEKSGHCDIETQIQNVCVKLNINSEIRRGQKFCSTMPETVSSLTKKLFLNSSSDSGDSCPYIVNWDPLRILGRGAFGEVHEVLTDKGIRCATKTIRFPIQLGSSMESGKIIEMAIDAERNLCQLSHPNIVKFLWLLQKGAEIVVFMELLEGDSLENKINDRDLSIWQIGRFASQICNALFYLHNQKQPVIHRDINCSNIMVLTGDLQIKLFDFGLSIKLIESATEYISSDDNPRGTLNFMAPELLEEQPVYSRESDIWAFGCTVYQMATGNIPHADCRNPYAFSDLLTRDCAPKLPDSCSEELKDFYNCCVVRDRKKRKSATELLKHKFLTSQDIYPVTSPQHT